MTYNNRFALAKFNESVNADPSIENVVLPALFQMDRYLLANADENTIVQWVKQAIEQVRAIQGNPSKIPQSVIEIECANYLQLLFLLLDFNIPQEEYYQPLNDEVLIEFYLEKSKMDNAIQYTLMYLLFDMLEHMLILRLPYSDTDSRYKTLLTFTARALKKYAHGEFDSSFKTHLSIRLCQGNNQTEALQLLTEQAAAIQEFSFAHIQKVSDYLKASQQPEALSLFFSIVTTSDDVCKNEGIAFLQACAVETDVESGVESAVEVKDDYDLDKIKKLNKEDKNYYLHLAKFFYSFKQLAIRDPGKLLTTLIHYLKATDKNTLNWINFVSLQLVDADSIFSNPRLLQILMFIRIHLASYLQYSELENKKLIFRFRRIFAFLPNQATPIFLSILRSIQAHYSLLANDLKRITLLRIKVDTSKTEEILDSYKDMLSKFCFLIGRHGDRELISASLPYLQLIEPTPFSYNFQFFGLAFTWLKEIHTHVVETQVQPKTAVATSPVRIDQIPDTGNNEILPYLMDKATIIPPTAYQFPFFLASAIVNCLTSEETILFMENWRAFNAKFDEIQFALEDRQRHQTKLRIFLVCYQFQLANLTQVMGADTFLFLKSYLVESALPLQRLLDTINILPAKTLEHLKFLYNKNRMALKNPKQGKYWVQLLMLSRLIFSLLTNSPEDQRPEKMPLFKKFNDNFFSYLNSEGSLEDINRLLKQLLFDICVFNLGVKRFDEKIVTMLLNNNLLEKLVDARQKMKDSGYQTVFNELLECDITNASISELLFDPDQDSEIGTCLALHNQRIVRILQLHDVKAEQVLAYKQQAFFSYHPGGHSVIVMNALLKLLHGYLVQLYKAIIDALQNSVVVDGQEAKVINTLKNIKKLIDGLGVGLTPETMAEFALRFKHIEQLTALDKKLQAIQPSSLTPQWARFLEFKTHCQQTFARIIPLKTELAPRAIIFVKKTHHFMIKRAPKDVFCWFLGDHVGCCLATDADQFPAMVQRRMDAAMFFDVVYELNTNDQEMPPTPVALSWLYFATKDDGKLCVVANFVELKATFGFDPKARDCIISSLLEFTGRFCQEIGVDYILRILNYGLIPDFTQFKEVTTRLQKVGGCLLLTEQQKENPEISEHYYLESVDHTRFHRYDKTKQTPEIQEHLATVNFTTRTEFDDEEKRALAIIAQTAADAERSDAALGEDKKPRDLVSARDRLFSKPNAIALCAVTAGGTVAGVKRKIEECADVARDLHKRREIPRFARGDTCE